MFGPVLVFDSCRLVVEMLKPGVLFSAGYRHRQHEYRACSIRAVGLSCALLITITSPGYISDMTFNLGGWVGGVSPIVWPALLPYISSRPCLPIPTSRHSSCNSDLKNDYVLLLTRIFNAQVRQLNRSSATPRLHLHVHNVHLLLSRPESAGN